VYLNASGTLLVQLRNSGGTVVASGTTTTNVKGVPVLASCELTPSGGNVAFAFRIITPGAVGIRIMKSLAFDGVAIERRGRNHVNCVALRARKNLPLVIDNTMLGIFCHHASTQRMCQMRLRIFYWHPGVVYVGLIALAARAASFAIRKKCPMAKKNALHARTSAR
jgi:hypothetical protein